METLRGCRKFYEPLFERLRELGYEEGRNLIVERRYAQGHTDRFQEFADEMVRLKVDVIIVVTTPAAQAAKRATTTIPIVHPAVIDPVGTGLVASLARPGGNLTGLAIPDAELTAKRLDVLREVIIVCPTQLFCGMRPTQRMRWHGKRRTRPLMHWA